MKSKKILFISLIVIVCFATIYAFAKEDSVFSHFGELTREQIESAQDSRIDGIETDYISILAKDFVISTTNLDNLTDQNKLTGKSTKDAKDMALSQLIVKRSLYYYAVNEGFFVDDETIKNSIEENREMMKEADNYSDFSDFLDGLGMSEDEYWEDQFDLYKLNYVVGEFKANKKKEFVKNNAEIMDRQELDKEFSEYFMDIAEEAVSKQKIRIDESINWTFSREDDYIIALCH